MKAINKMQLNRLIYYS